MLVLLLVVFELAGGLATELDADTVAVAVGAGVAAAGVGAIAGVGVVAGVGAVAGPVAGPVAGAGVGAGEGPGIGARFALGVCVAGWAGGCVDSGTGTLIAEAAVVDVPMATLSSSSDSPDEESPPPISNDSMLFPLMVI